MATTLTSGYIYFVESESVGGDDWINDHAGDPDAIDLDAMTEGTEYCKIELPKRWVKTFRTGITVTDAGGGTSFEHRASIRGYSLLSEGLKTSIANANLVEQFFMIDRHTSGSDAIFKGYYLVVKFATSSYAEFKDASASAMKEYCPIRVISGSSTWDENSPQSMTIRLNTRSKW